MQVDSHSSPIHRIDSPITAPLPAPSPHRHQHYRSASGNSINLVRGNTPIQSNLRIQKTNSPGVYTQPYQQRQPSPMSFTDDYGNNTNNIEYNPYYNQQAQQAQHLSLPRPHSARPMSSNSSISSTYRNSDIDPLPLPNYSGGGHSRQPSSAGSLSEHATQSASASMFDLSQSYISTQFGPKSSALMPRIQTIEMYRKNAKKSNDPVIQFQFAQYMLQTALLSMNGQQKGGVFSGDLTSSASSSTTASSSSDNNGSSSNTSNFSGLNPTTSGNTVASPTKIDEKKIKNDLLKEAISILRKLSDRGFADAQYLLGDALASGALGKPDLRESFSLFQLAAKHGHGEAAYRAALCLERGWGTSKDIRRAVQFLRMAASRNQPGAMLRLGMACFYGRMGMSNTPQVKQEGIKWLKLAANEATEVFPQAPYELAKIVEVGYSDIVIPDQHWAVQLYVKSAELNYVPAARVLGKAYELSLLGCPRDAALSIHYYTLGAIKGDPESMYSMCAWYMMGAEPVLQKNEEEAYEWALRSANAGHPKAQFAVGYFLEHGTGVERDILQSSFWYHKAAEAGNEHAINRLAKEKSQLSKTKKSSKDSNSKDKECIIS